MTYFELEQMRSAEEKLRQQISGLQGNEHLVESYEIIRKNIADGKLDQGWGVMILGGRLNKFRQAKYKKNDKVLTVAIINGILDAIELAHFGKVLWGPDNYLYKKVMEHGIELLEAHGEDEAAEQWRLKIHRNLNFKVEKP